MMKINKEKKYLISRKLEQSKGITLIALVVTIIVLLILAGVSIAMLTGEGGILKNASEAKIESTHAEVKEAMQLEYADYILEKNTKGSTQTLIEYLQGRNIIPKDPEEEGKYIINVEALVGGKISLGNGTDGKDVYKLEEVADGVENGKINEKLASKTPIKIAAKNTEKIYKIVYYGKNATENMELGYIKDSETKKSELITFYIATENWNTGKEYPDDIEFNEYTCVNGWTWKEWCSSEYNTIAAASGTGEIYAEPEYIEIPSIGFGLIQPVGDYNEHCRDTDKIESGGHYVVSYPGGECVYPNSNILVSKDGKTVQAKDIKEGNNIAYYNFETNKVEIGKVQKAYIHKQARDFVKYEFEDGTYLEATDYHPIYTKQGWKSYTRRNGYEVPVVGDEIKTENGWKKLTKIESFQGLEDCYDFEIIGVDGQKVNNYFANGTLVQGSY